MWYDIYYIYTIHELHSIVYSIELPKNVIFLEVIRKRNVATHAIFAALCVKYKMHPIIKCITANKISDQFLNICKEQ